MSRTRYRQGLPPFARGMPRWDRWFADSSLEGEGFEPSVPRRERRFLSGNGNRHRGDKSDLERGQLYAGRRFRIPFPSAVSPRTFGPSRLRILMR